MQSLHKKRSRLATILIFDSFSPFPSCFDDCCFVSQGDTGINTSAKQNLVRDDLMWSAAHLCFTLSAAERSFVCSIGLALISNCGTPSLF